MIYARYLKNYEVKTLNLICRTDRWAARNEERPTYKVNSISSLYRRTDEQKTSCTKRETDRRTDAQEKLSMI